MSNNLNRADIARHLSNNLGISVRQAQELVELFFETIGQTLQVDEKVKLPNFGTFQCIDKRLRMGRNPLTGEQIPIQPRKVVSFRPSRKLRKQIDNYHGGH